MKLLRTFLKKKIEKNILFINMPISSEEEDKIGISQYASELKSAISNGAQSIAVTSDFGGGKSSLIRCLEAKYSGLMTKFCYVNLWSQLNCTDENGDSSFEKGSGAFSACTGHISENLHKSLLYQIASQINYKRGNYVSRRLSRNYGVLGITLPSLWMVIISFFMALSFVVGLACTTFYDVISEYISINFYDDYHKEIGVACFSLALIMLLFVVFKTDIIFSTNKSESNRIIDEHELMDIYKTHICKFHLKHYIVVIEDLDRSEKESVNRFIKELRRYYIPSFPKRSKHKVVNLFNRIRRDFNRITFIVNIKSEHDIATDDDRDLYSKVFDYVLNLKEINIDNYDVILNKLLEDNRSVFREKGIPAFNDENKFIPEFEWIIRGPRNGIREIKIRLNAAISTYVNLCSKFKREYVSLPKCIAAAYVLTAFEEEYIQIKDIGFDDIIDLYVMNQNMTEADIAQKYQNAHVSVNISAEFAEDIKTLIKNGLIASDYRQYFFNFPSDSHLHSDKQVRLNNILLYNHDISNDKTFNDLVLEVVSVNDDIVIDAYNRLKRLGKCFPNCVFYSPILFRTAMGFDIDLLKKTLSEELEYDNESITSTAKIIIEVIKSNLIDDSKHLKMVCDIILNETNPRALVTFRKMLIDSFYDEIIKFKDLFLGEAPLITKSELNALKSNLHLFELINYDSTEIDIEWVESAHASMLAGLDMNVSGVLDQVAAFYEKIFALLGTTEKEILTKYMFEIMSCCKVINKNFERVLVNNNDFDDIEDRYIREVCLADVEGEISCETLRYINDFGVNCNLSESICVKLRDSNYYKSFIVNACKTNIDLIDFSDEIIVETINSIDFLDKDDKMVSLELLLLLRKCILKESNELAINSYNLLFKKPYPIINADEIHMIYDRMSALIVIDEEQIDVENSLYIAEYFNAINLSLNESYQILLFVSTIKDIEMRKTLFLNLNFEKIPYYRISSKRKNSIICNMSASFDFDDIEDMILYMKHTKCSYSLFEKKIKKLITDKKFNEYEKLYQSVEKVTQRVAFLRSRWYNRSRKAER